eukprot:9918646-Alexandrium_andersonii.AAC.1
MSASLVGSEMCIRDSRRLRGVPGKASRRRIADAHLYSTQLTTWPGRDAVSYTHLTLPTICSV